MSFILERHSFLIYLFQCNSKAKPDLQNKRRTFVSADTLKIHPEHTKNYMYEWIRSDFTGRYFVWAKSPNYKQMIPYFCRIVNTYSEQKPNMKEKFSCFYFSVRNRLQNADSLLLLGKMCVKIKYTILLMLNICSHNRKVQHYEDSIFVFCGKPLLAGYRNA